MVPHVTPSESVEWVGPSGEVCSCRNIVLKSLPFRDAWRWGSTKILKAYEQPLKDNADRLALANGIRLDGLVDDQEQINLAKLLVGSQGTLGIITEATVRTEPIAAHRGVCLLFFNRWIMLRVVQSQRSARRIACDLMDRRLLEIARETEPAFAKILPSRDVEAMVLVEVQGEVVPTLQDRIKAIELDLVRERRLATGSLSTVNREQRDLFWALSRRVIRVCIGSKASKTHCRFVRRACAAEHLPNTC